MALANGVVADGPDAGCPVAVDASVAILGRCTPLRLAHAVEGAHIDLIADAERLWFEAALLLTAVLVLGLFFHLVHVRIRPGALFAMTAILLVAAGATVCVTAALFNGAPNPSTATGKDADAKLGRTVAAVNHWTSFGVAVGGCALCLLWTAGLWVVGWSPITASRPVLRLWGSVYCRATAGLYPLAVLLVLILLGMAAWVAVGSLALVGGCTYAADTSVDGKLIVGRYPCDAMLVRSMPWLGGALLLCTYYSLLALQAGVVSRQVAVDFAWRLHPLSSTMRQGCGFCGCAAAKPALRNPGQLHMDGLLSLATLPFRCWGAIGVGKPDTTGCVRWLSKMTRLHAVETGMARSTPLHRGSGALLTLLKTNRRFSDAALIGGGFSAHCGTVCLAVASWLAADIWLRHGHSAREIRYPAVAAAALGVLCGLIANFLFDAVRTGCDTLAVLCLAEARATTAIDHDRLLPLELLALLRPPPGSAYEMTSIGGGAAGQDVVGRASPVLSRNDSDVVITRFGGEPMILAAAAAPASGSRTAAESPPTMSPQVPGYIGSTTQRSSPGPSTGTTSRLAAATDRMGRSTVQQNARQNVSNAGGGDRTSGPYGFDTFDRGGAMPPPRAVNAWGESPLPSDRPAEPALLNEIAGLLDSSADHRSPTASPTPGTALPELTEWLPPASPTMPGAALPELPESTPPDDPPAYSPIDTTTAAAARGRSASVRDSMAGVCKICMDKDANQVLFPCKHLCLCEDCVEMVRVTTPAGEQPPCPICRTPFGRATSVFIS